MNLLLLTYNVVGQSNYLRAEGLAAALAEQGHDLTLVGTRRRPDRETVRSVQIGDGILRRLTVPSSGDVRRRNSGLSLAETRRRRRLLRAHSYDLVHGFGHRPTVSQVGPYLASSLGIPYVMDWCDLFGNGGIAGERKLAARVMLGGFDTWLERRSVRRADAVTVISSALAARARRLARGRPITMIRPGALATSADRTTVQAVRDRYQVPDRAPVVIHVSQNHQDVDLLVATLISVARRCPEAHLLLVGPEIGAVADSARRHGFEGRVHLTGPIEHAAVAAHLATASVALLPYPPSIKNECRFPCSFSEYMGAGLPVVTQPTGDLPRIGNQQPGAVFVDADADAMSDAVERILLDPLLADALRARAVRVAETELKWSAGAARLTDLYARLTAAESSVRVLAAT